MPYALNWNENLYIDKMFEGYFHGWSHQTRFTIHGQIQYIDSWTWVTFCRRRFRKQFGKIFTLDVDAIVIITGNCMMTPSNGNIFRVTGHFLYESTGHRWIPLTKHDNPLSVGIWCVLYRDLTVLHIRQTSRRKVANCSWLNTHQIDCYKQYAYELHVADTCTLTKPPRLTMYGFINIF